MPFLLIIFLALTTSTSAWIWKYICGTLCSRLEIRFLPKYETCICLSLSDKNRTTSSNAFFANHIFSTNNINISMDFEIYVYLCGTLCSRLENRFLPNYETWICLRLSEKNKKTSSE